MTTLVLSSLTKVYETSVSEWKRDASDIKLGLKEHAEEVKESFKELKQNLDVWGKTIADRK